MNKYSNKAVGLSLIVKEIEITYCDSEENNLILMDILYIASTTIALETNRFTTLHRCVVL